MKKYTTMRYNTMFLLLGLMVSGVILGGRAVADSPIENISVKGWGFFRGESKRDADYRPAQGDRIDFSQLRLNFSARAVLAENYGYVLFSPQFSRISGKSDYVSASNSDQLASGALYNPRLDVFEGYIAAQPLQSESFQILLGRQQLAYGDHRVLGSVPWHYVGRSFDAVLGRIQISTGHKVDFFSSKMNELNAAGAVAAARDGNLHGAYYNGALSGVDVIEAYFLNRDNIKTFGFMDSLTLGTRLKSKILDSSFDYQFEGGVQRTRPVSSGYKNAHNYDLEFGYTHSPMKTRFAIQGLYASRNFDQLFPTAHKFLGYADQFSRRNIMSTVFKLNVNPAQKWVFQSDFHVFRRATRDAPVYDFVGASLGSSGNAQAIANEVDLVLSYNFSKSLQFSAGYSQVFVGRYIRDQNIENRGNVHWGFLQAHTWF